MVSHIKANIAIGGMQHESNSFSPIAATYQNFENQDSWPGLVSGKELFETMSGLNIPITGFFEAALQEGKYELHPMLWASAEPSGPVTEDAFERISDMLCESLVAVGDVDAVYLDLHGAFVSDHLQDGEGELLKRIRSIVGNIPIIVSLDLHANVTEEMIQNSTAITIYRTYPHLDMAETGVRAYELMRHALAGVAIVGGMRKMPFLVPLPSQGTNFEPCKSIYQSLDVKEDSSGILSVDCAMGFPPSDIFECGGALVAYGTDRQQVDNVLDDFYKELLEVEHLFENVLMLPDQAVQKAMLNTSGEPVVIADAQDNPGAGATSDTTGMLEALVRNNAQEAVLAILHDPDAAALAHKAGVGSLIELELGAKSDVEGVFPFKGKFVVDALGDGCFVLTGDMYKDSRADLGMMALLRVAATNCDVQVIVGSERAQCLDLAMLRHLGVDPENKKILVVKSTVHFRADFEPISSEVLVAAAPGAHPCRLANLQYRKLRADVRLEPMGIVHSGSGPVE